MQCVDLSKLIPSTTHSSMGTMTAPSSNAYDRGTWTIIHDSLTDNAYWGLISWNSYEPRGTKVTVRARSSNDKINWSTWEEASNGLNLKLTPRGRYLEIEIALEKFNSTQSPVVYDITIKNLDSNVLTTDLGVGITGDKNTLNLGETVKLIIKAVNNGPNSANVKVDYKIPFGLKLLSSQGQGTYDMDNGIWSMGVLPAGSNAQFELILQSNNAGSIVNTATVYSDLPDGSAFNNQGWFDLVVNIPNPESIPSGEMNTLPYKFPDNIGPNSPPNNPPILMGLNGDSGGSGGSGLGPGGSGGSGD